LNNKFKKNAFYVFGMCAIELIEAQQPIRLSQQFCDLFLQFSFGVLQTHANQKNLNVFDLNCT
jgi:hypothetical protein